MRVLLVAPRTNLLLVDEEVQNVLRSGLAVTPLIGPVTRGELLREIIAGSYDILWFATHGNSDGIVLSDGLLSASELVPQVRERFRLVVLNSCSSLSIAQMLQEEANVDVVCTIVDVPDQQAFRQGSLLAAALVHSVTYAGAYRRSRFGNNRIYLYLAALAPSDALLKPLMQQIEKLNTSVSELSNVVARERRWWRTVVIISLALHPITWFVSWLVWRF